MLPPDLFPPSMQPLIYFVILPLIVYFGIAFVAICWFIVFPPEAKLYILNRLRKKPMVDYDDESGTRHLETAKIYPEGILKCDKSKNIFFLPRPISNKYITQLLQAEKPNMTKDQIEKMLKTIRESEKTTLKPSIVKGTGTPIFRGWQSKAIVTNMATLVGLENNSNSKNMLVAIPIATKDNIRLNPAQLLIKKGKETIGVAKEWVANVLLPVDCSVIQKWFDPQYTQSQVTGLQELSERIGAAKNKNVLMKWMPLIIIFIIVMAVIMIAALFLG